MITLFSKIPGGYKLFYSFVAAPYLKSMRKKEKKSNSVIRELFLLLAFLLYVLLLVGGFLFSASFLLLMGYKLIVGIGITIIDLFNGSEPVNFDNDIWLPGLDPQPENDTDSPVNPDVHEVDGYYNSNGNYVDPYTRSDPDSSTSNNLAP